MKTVGKIVLGIVIAAVLLVGGCTAFLGAALDDSDTAKDTSASSGKQSGDSSGDKASKSTAENVVGNWTIENFNAIKFTEEYGSFKNVPLQVRNTSDGADSPWFEIRLTDKKGDLVASFDCIGDEYEAGQGGKVDCSTLDDFAPFADWEIKNAF